MPLKTTVTPPVYYVARNPTMPPSLVQKTDTPLSTNPDTVEPPLLSSGPAPILQLGPHEDDRFSVELNQMPSQEPELLAWDRERRLQEVTARIGNELFAQMPGLASRDDIHIKFAQLLQREIDNGALNADQPASLQFELKHAADRKRDAASTTAEKIRTNERPSNKNLAIQTALSGGSTVAAGTLLKLGFHPSGQEALDFFPLVGGIGTSGFALLMTGLVVKMVHLRSTLERSAATAEAEAMDWNRISDALNHPRVEV